MDRSYAKRRACCVRRLLPANYPFVIIPGLAATPRALGAIDPMHPPAGQTRSRSLTMDHGVEGEVAAAASVGGFLRWRRTHALPPGSLCRNCNTALQGPWCHNCGQLGEDFHRSIWHLGLELIESLFHADGRLFHTVPRLVLRPAQLTHDYLSGRRASQVPPLRMFLVVLLLVFLVGGIAARPAQNSLVHLAAKPADTSDIDKINVHTGTRWDAALTSWTRTHVGLAAAHPDQFVDAMWEWAHDVAFLAMPLSALILSALFAFRRGFVVFDHLIFSMHSLSFQGLLIVAATALTPLLGAQVGWLWLVPPIHLYAHMRGVYGTSRWGTVLRMSVLATATLVAFIMLILVLVVLGMASLRG